MTTKRIYSSLTILILALCLHGCTEYLEEKPLKSMVIPHTLDDLEAILNSSATVLSSAALPEMAADNYYISAADWQTIFGQSGFAPSYYDQCLNYLWDKDAYENSWADVYTYPVYYTNVVLDMLPAISSGDPARIQKIRGSALFYRAFAFERLAQLYAKPYSSASEQDLGIVLRTTAAIEVDIPRATVRVTYDKIVADLKEAAEILPESSPFPTLPVKAAAYAALSRVYLSMREYALAGQYADLSLASRDGLMDYNDYLHKDSPGFPEYNKEVIFHSQPIGQLILSSSYAKVDSFLYRSYASNDLRKTLFFRENTGDLAGTYSYTGSYAGRFDYIGDMVFDGLTTAEMYLNRAESYARAGNKDAALADLNTLMVKRWRNDGSWRPFETSSAAEALELILTERRKELVFRGLRWSDLRRLNEEGRNITLTRDMDGLRYALPPNDLRWVMLIPQETIQRSGLVQNPR